MILGWATGIQLNTYVKTFKKLLTFDRPENIIVLSKYMEIYYLGLGSMPEVKNAYMTLGELLYYANMEEREEAIIETMVQAILNLLEDYGDIPERVKNRLQETNDKAILKKWLKLAAKSNSIEEFEAALHLDSVPKQV